MPKIIHVGMPKAASSSIQAYLSSIDGLPYLGKLDRHGAYCDERLKHTYWRYVVHNKHNTPLWKFRQHVSKVLDEHGVPKDHYVISDEALSGIGFGMFRRTPRPLPGIVRTLAGIHGADAKFIVVLRQQPRLLLSYYAQLVRHGYPLTLKTFLQRQMDKHPDALRRGIRYAAIIKQCRKEGFQIHPVLFEDLIKNVTPLRSLLAEWGIDAPETLPAANPSSRDIHTLRLLRKNRNGTRTGHDKFSKDEGAIDKKQFAKLSRIHEITAPDEIWRAVEDLFRKDNCELAEVLERDLGVLGYPV